MKQNSGQKQIKVSLVMALTADGFIARGSHDFVNWSSSADKKFFAGLSKDAKAVVMGKNTFDTFDGILPGRLNIVMTSQKKDSDNDLLLFWHKEPEELIDFLAKKGLKKLVLAGGSFTNYKFYEKGLIDEVFVTISPVMFGQGVSLFNKEINACLELKNLEKLDKETIMIHYLLKNKGGI